MPEQRSATEARNLDIVLASFDAWRDGRGSPFDLLAEDAVWTIAGQCDAAGTYASRERFLAEVIRPFNARMREPLKPNVRRLYADGDTVIALFDAKGVAADGKPYANSYAWFMQFEQSQIVRAEAFFDGLEFNDFWRRVTPAEAT